MGSQLIEAHVAKIVRSLEKLVKVVFKDAMSSPVHSTECKSEFSERHCLISLRRGKFDTNCKKDSDAFLALGVKSISPQSEGMQGGL